MKASYGNKDNDSPQTEVHVLADANMQMEINKQKEIERMMPKIKRNTIFNFLKHIFYTDYWNGKRKMWRERSLCRGKFELEQEIIKEQNQHEETQRRMEHKMRGIDGELLGTQGVNLAINKIWLETNTKDLTGNYNEPTPKRKS